MPRDEDFHGEGYDGELEKRSELVYDLPEPAPDAPTGDGDGGGERVSGADGGAEGPISWVWMCQHLQNVPKNVPTFAKYESKGLTV